MPFTIGKILGFLAFPSAMILLALVVGLLGSFLPAAFASLRSAARALLAVAVVAQVVIGLTPAWWAAIAPLEDRFPVLSPGGAEPAGIVLIGGMIDGATEPTAGQAKKMTGIEAIDLAIDLARRHPHVPIVFSGTGTIEDDGSDLSEAATMARVVAAAGIDPQRFVLERRARTTWENAVYSHRLVSPAPGARWLLVTPAWHMPRSIGAFRAAGWDGVVAAPSIGESARTGGINTPPSERMRLFDIAAREWSGLLAYRLLGRSSALFPAP